MTVTEIADVLENAPRRGGDVDRPEGNRYAMFSDTMLRGMAQDLRLAAGDRPDVEEFSSGRRRESR